MTNRTEYLFATSRAERRVATLERSIKRGPPGLTISPDGHWILYTRIDQSGSDIMLLENFPRRAGLPH